MFIEGSVELLLPGPVYLVFFMLLATILAWRRVIKSTVRARIVLTVVTVWTFLASTPGFANAMLWALENRGMALAKIDGSAHEEEAVILVLASGYGRQTARGKEVRLGESGWERTEAGVELWRRIGGRLVFTGQPVETHGSSVAEVMARKAISMGVPSDSVEAESESRNTYENILFARTLVQNGAGSVWIVTSAAHLPRAMAIARKLGIPARGVPCDFRAIPYRGAAMWLPHNNAFEKARIALHEYAGMAYYWWKGWI